MKSSLSKFLDGEDGYTDRWCILCVKPFRISTKLDLEKERYNICPDCWTYAKR